jgi:hypothetical protein
MKYVKGVAGDDHTGGRKGWRLDLVGRVRGGDGSATTRGQYHSFKVERERSVEGYKLEVDRFCAPLERRSAVWT